MALNLACLLDVGATQALRECWEAATESRHDPLLDVYAVLESNPTPDDADPTRDALGIPLAGSVVIERLEAFLEDALRRMTVRRLK